MEDPDTAMTRKPADEEPFSALAFKIMADKYVGTLTFCRVYRYAGHALISSLDRDRECVGSADLLVQ